MRYEIWHSEMCDMRYDAIRYDMRYDMRHDVRFKIWDMMWHITWCMMWDKTLDYVWKLIQWTHKRKLTWQVKPMLEMKNKALWNRTCKWCVEQKYFANSTMRVHARKMTCIYFLRNGNLENDGKMLVGHFMKIDSLDKCV